MNCFFYLRNKTKGSALLTVMMLIILMAVLTTSILQYSAGERRGNERNRLILRAKNMAENVALYSAEQISTKLHRLKTVNQMQFSSGVNQLYLPPDAVLTTQYSQPSNVETYAGITSNTGLALITDTTNPNYGLQALTAMVPIIAKSTMAHPALGSVTSYAEQDMQISEIPLFQFAIFYDPDLEFGPGANMTISGPVNTNGNFIARDQTGFTNTVAFLNRVTAVGGFFANTSYKGTTYNEFDGADTGPGGTGPLYFQNPTGTQTNINSGSVWRDHLYGGSTVTTTTVANFKTFATSAYGGNLQTSAMGVAPLTLPGIDTTIANSGRAVINVPNNTTDTADVIAAGTQFSRKAGLYIIVNPTAQVRNGYLPYEPSHSPSSDATVSMRAYSYRCFLNTINTTDGTHTIREVVLPGQPSFGALNAYINTLPNAYRADTSVSRNQVLRIPQGGSPDLADTGYATGTPTMTAFQDAYFYDLRRSTNSNGHPFSRSTSNFLPRPITKIDFDMTRFKMMVDRTYFAATTSTVFSPALPNSTTWSSSIYNTAAASASYGLGLSPGSTIDYSIFPGSSTVSAIQRSPSGVFFPATITISGSTQNGVAAPTAYASRFTVETTTATPTAAGVYTGWTAVGTVPLDGSSDIASTTYSPSGATLTAIRITQYAAGAAISAARMLDQQTIPVVDATVALNASLTSDYLTLPSNASGASPLFQNAVTDMRVYVNGVDDTANWTFSAAATPSGIITGKLGGVVTATTAAQNGSGQFENRYTATAMTGTVATAVTISAARTGYTTLSRTFTLAKQSSVAAVASPTQYGFWLGVGGQPTPNPFGLYFAPVSTADWTNVTTNPAALAVAPTDLYSTGTGPWYDGLAVYVQSVDAEVVTSTAGVRDRMDSAVRLWNGRCTTPSFTASGTTGFSICTNDAVYIVGHFNADGTINSTTTATGNGGYSALYPDSANEYLASVMGDAMTIYSQPVFTVSGSNYYQSDGWSDSLSANRCRSTSYSTSWSTSNPSSSNAVDGTNTSITPATLPNLGNIGTAAPGASATTTKLGPTVTEVSAALLAGIVPTTSHQNSGGAHNFPRLNEDWNGTALYIRGSMVAMFASQIATEPWSIRIYSGAERDWGLHYNLTNAHHDLPLEPMVISASRLGYRELNAASYNTMKTTILALPVP
jgi:hypothetical protein